MPTFNEWIGGEENAEEFRRTMDAINRRATAAMQEVWKRMPWDQVIDLPGGEQAVIKPFVEPRIKDGVLEFGFDVRDTLGGWHLEFFAQKTGGGGKPINPMEIPDQPSDKT